MRLDDVTNTCVCMDGRSKCASGTGCCEICEAKGDDWFQRDPAGNCAKCVEPDFISMNGLHDNLECWEVAKS